MSSALEDLASEPDDVPAEPISISALDVVIWTDICSVEEGPGASEDFGLLSA